MNDKKLHLLGTDHAYQFGIGVYGHTDCTAEAEAAFSRLIKNLCHDRKIKAIGEELNDDALKEKNKTESIPFQVAKQLYLHHRYCEPNHVERSDLLIFDDNQITLIGFPNRRAESEIAADKATAWEKREQFWLDRILELNTWPLLFICGSLHVPTFSGKLMANGIEFQIEHRSWVP